jgi:hypothetical protein
MRGGKATLRPPVSFRPVCLRHNKVARVPNTVVFGKAVPQSLGADQPNVFHIHKCDLRIDYNKPRKCPMRTLLPLMLVLIGVSLQAGCATADSMKAPGVDLSHLKTFYVQKLPADGRGIERLISDRLKMMGFESSYGESDTPPTPVDAIITYQDRWMWDITMYMIQLDVQVRSGTTRVVIANGRSFRPSLQRLSPEGMVEEVLQDIFKK